jgi:hypothetical protein
MIKIKDYTQEQKEEVLEAGKSYTELKEIANYSRKQIDFGEVIRVQCGNEEYDIYIEGLYPFQPPRVYKVTDPSGDILEAAIQKPWGPDLKLKDIVSCLPCPFRGKYHLGHTFPVYLFSKFPVFSCQALEPGTYKPMQELKLIITPTTIFQVQEFNSDSGHLTAYGTIETIQELKLSWFKDKFSISWRGTIKHIQIFKSKKSKDIVETVLQQITNKGLKLNKLVIPRKSIKPEDVSPERMLKVKILDIEADIIETELEIEHELSKSKINSLLKLYQKAIEYYSAIGDEKFCVYLKKNNSLMADPQIMSVLIEEAQEVVINDSKIAKELEELEIWPTNIN